MTTTPATTILNKVYVRHLIKVARGQSYASNPGGSTPRASSSPSGQSTASPSAAKVPSWVNTAGSALDAAGSAAWNYGGKQTVRPALNVMHGISTVGRGAANALGGGVGNAVSAVGYGIGAGTDAAGLTNNAKGWVADNMWKHTNNAVWSGLEDVGGGIADIATGGAYDHDGTFAAPGTHAGTAVEKARSELRDTLGRGTDLDRAFRFSTGASNLAAEQLAFAGAGRGLNVAAKTLQGSQAAAPVLNAAAQTPVVGRPAAAAGRWFAGPAPKANMFDRTVNTGRGVFRGQGIKDYYVNTAKQQGGLAWALSDDVQRAADEVMNSNADPVQDHQQYLAERANREQQYQQDTALRNAFRGSSDEHAVTNAMMQDPAILNRMQHGGVPTDAAVQLAVDGQLPTQTDAELDSKILDISREDPRTKAIAAGTQLAGGQMNVADGAPQTTPQAPEPSTFVQSTFPDAPPEVQTQLTDATAKVQQAAAKDPAGMAAAADPESEAGQEYINGPAFEKYTEERKDSAPDNPQEFGAWMNNMMTEFQKLDPMSQVGIGLGLGTGVLGLLSGLMGGGGIGSFLLGALGLGAAGFMGANAGMFGQSGSQMMGDMAYNLGTMTGLVPESADLSALKGENALQRLMSQGGAIGSREEVKAQIASVRDQAGKLQQLMSLPLGDEAKIRLMQRLDPSIDSLEAGQQALTNAQQIMAAYNDPNSALNKKLLAGENYANMTGWQGDLTEKGIGAAQTAGTALGRMANTATDYLTNLFTKRTKRSTDMNIAQQIIIEQLITKSARCWAGYEPVPGKKPYSNDSCRPVGSKKKKKKKAEKTN